MAAKAKAAKAGAAVAAAKENPYVQRLVEDEDLRQNIVRAFESSKSAYGRLSDGKSPAAAIFDDRKLQREVQAAAQALRDASVALREAPKAQKGGGLGKKLLLLIVAGGAALALSEGLRKKVLDALFGAEEEFEYTSPTTAASTGSSGTGASSGTEQTTTT